MTESSDAGGTHPADIELARRAAIFHDKLAVLKTYNGKPPWDVLCDTALASHFLYSAQQRAPEPDVWERASAIIDLIRLAKDSEPEGGTIEIGLAAAQEMIFRATEDPDHFERLKDFCAYALTGEPMPYSGETTFKLHPLLSRWIGNVSSGEVRKPKTRKRQVLSGEIINWAIAATVHFLAETSVPVFRNEATYSSINACDAVAKILPDALGRKAIKGDAVHKIYYKSNWSKLKSRYGKLEKP